MSKTINKRSFVSSSKIGGKNDPKLLAILLISLIVSGYSFWLTSFLSSQYVAFLIAPLVLFASLSWLMSAFHRSVEISASERFEELIFIDDINAEIEIIRGFREEFYLKSFVVQVRIINGSNSTVSFIASSLEVRFKDSLGEWKDRSAKHGKIAPLRTATVSSSKFHLNQPFKISDGMVQLEGEILSIHKYFDIRYRKKAERTESKSVRILLNRESNNLRYRVLTD